MVLFFARVAHAAPCIAVLPAVYSRAHERLTARTIEAVAVL